MELYPRIPIKRDPTPNCVDCSRSLEHAVCKVLHLFGTDWRIEQTPRRDVTQTHVVSPRDAA
jgi:hypothetical protein